MLTPFKNEPFTNFDADTNREAMRQALARVNEQLGQTYPLRIGAEQIASDDLSQSLNPTHPDQIVGRFAKATTAHADQAIQAAHAAFASWRRVPPEQRANFLFKA